MKDFLETGFEAEFELHQNACLSLWREADIQIDGDEELNKAIRFNVFHLMNTASESDSHVNIGSPGKCRQKRLSGSPVPLGICRRRYRTMPGLDH